MKKKTIDRTFDGNDILVITLYCFSYSAETDDENTPFIVHHIRRKKYNARFGRKK